MRLRPLKRKNRAYRDSALSCGPGIHLQHIQSPRLWIKRFRVALRRGVRFHINDHEAKIALRIPWPTLRVGCGGGEPNDVNGKPHASHPNAVKISLRKHEKHPCVLGKRFSASEAKRPLTIGQGKLNRNGGTIYEERRTILGNAAENRIHRCRGRRSFSISLYSKKNNEN